MSLNTDPTQVMATMADELCELTAEVIRPRLEDLLDANEPDELRAQAAAAVVVMIRQMAEKLQVEQTCELIRQIVIPSMVWIWQEPPQNISMALGVVETLAQLAWLRPGDTITVPEDFAEIDEENALILVRAAIAVSARGAGVFGDEHYGDRLRTLV